MKKITNTSKRVVSINGKVVMPDATIEVDDKVAALASVKAIAKYNGLKIEDVATAETAATTATATAETAAKKTAKKTAEATTETTAEG